MKANWSGARLKLMVCICKGVQRRCHQHRQQACTSKSLLSIGRSLIHVLRLSLDPAKGSRTASWRTRWIYLPDGFYHGLVKSKRYLATDRIAIAAQAHFAAVLAENNLRGVLVCMLVSARSRAITTPG